MTNFSWTHAFPTKTKSEARASLSLMVQRDGVPPWMIVDGSKYQVGGDFSRKCK